ncbi:MAG: hypothetical protein PHV17_06640 [Candidatus Omnitrophica bacterium]|nr:hypothetical protein [Candidatus Omnitrophota bacterium]
MKLKKSLSLAELVMVIVIASIIMIPLSLIVSEALRRTFLPEHLTISTSLLEGELEKISNLRFDQVINQTGNYSGIFSRYSFNNSFYYVNPGDLNSPAANVTDFKRLTISISRAGFSDVKAVTLVTKN